MLFNIYYINTSKVYEISMMINNVIIGGIERENTNSIETNYEDNSSLSINYLNQIKATMGSKTSEKSQESNRIVERLEIKTTKSILLKKIVNKCKITNKFKGLNEGDLIKIRNVKLKLENEEELRQVKVFANGAFKGVNVEGIEINNMVNSMLKDYTYVLTGEINGEKLIFKVPLLFENEFENLYNIDDLLIGNVTIIGIYKEKVNKSSIKNTFSYILKLGEKESENIIQNSSKRNSSNNNDCMDNDDEYNFIDIIAVVQDIYKNEQIIQKNEETKKNKLWHRIKSFFVPKSNDIIN